MDAFLGADDYAGAEAERLRRDHTDMPTRQRVNSPSQTRWRYRAAGFFGTLLDDYWRERVGIEPTQRRFRDTTTDLKSAEATRLPSAPPL